MSSLRCVYDVPTQPLSPQHTFLLNQGTREDLVYDTMAGIPKAVDTDLRHLIGRDGNLDQSDA